MTCVTAVDGEWLAELGPMFFSVKRSFQSRITKRTQEQSNKEVRSTYSEPVKHRSFMTHTRVGAGINAC